MNYWLYTVVFMFVVVFTIHRFVGVFERHHKQLLNSGLSSAYLSLNFFNRIFMIVGRFSLLEIFLQIWLLCLMYFSADILGALAQLVISSYQ